MIQKVVNYIVHIQDWHGHRQVECKTEKEAWDAIGSCAFGGLYQVSSPTGKDTYDFIPF